MGQFAQQNGFKEHRSLYQFRSPAISNSAWLHPFVNQLPDAVLLEYMGKIVFSNAAAMRLYNGITQEAFFSTSLYDLTAEEDRDNLVDSINRLHTGQACYSSEERGLSLSGQVIDIDAVRMLVPYENATAVCMIAKDITKRKRRESQLWHDATHDQLTGLPNRSFLGESLEAATSGRKLNQHVALSFIDLDCFKQVNDRHGHAFGDLLLKAVADRLVACVRKTDLVARVGGDEFVLLLNDYVSESEINGVLHRVLDCVSQPQNIMGKEISITCSIGYSLLPEESQAAEELICPSDAAMYAAKKAGGNKVQIFIPNKTLLCRTEGSGNP